MEIFKTDGFRLFINSTWKSVVVLIVASILIRVFIRSVEKLFHTSSRNPKKETLISVISSLIKYIIYFMAIMIILELYGFSTRSIVTVAGIGSVALGLGAQALVKDIISGLFILTEDQFNVGDFITIGEFSGTVEALKLRTTILRTVEGEQCIIPNGEIRGVRNYSRDFMNAYVKFYIPYGVDVDELQSLIKESLSSFYLEDEMLEKPKLLGITELQGNNFSLLVTCKTKTEAKWSVERKIRVHLLKLFDKHKIPVNSNIVQIKENK